MNTKNNKKSIDIDKLIDLANFDVTEDEKIYFEKEIESFLDYAQILNSSKCNDMEAVTHPVNKKGYLRSDKSTSWEHMEGLLKNAPILEGSSYLVPPQKGRTGKEKEFNENNIVKDTSDYEVVIGLEVHAHLKTKSKLFCSCSTEFGSSANANTCPVCSGQPGALPVLNQEAVNLAILAGLACNCTINKRSVFERKNYFYPDLPNAYQISQLEKPICSGGYVEIDIDGVRKKVKLNRIHMEEDAGKMVHVGAPGIWGSKASAVDFNRTSIPLIEIVTEPDLSSAREAKEYVMMLRTILINQNICDGNLEEGSLRCDANISIRPRGSKTLGTKTEIKNMNSFKAIEKAIEFEIERQKKMVKLGVKIDQETRLWDESSQKTHIMRTKEDADDYRYFPDPDLLPLVLDDDLINELKKRLVMLPLDKKKKFEDSYGLTSDESNLLVGNPNYANYFESVLQSYNNPKNVANWFFNEILSYIGQDFHNIHIKPDDFVTFLKKIDANEISGKIGKGIIKKSFDTKKSLVSLISEDDVKQISDPNELENIVNDILSKNSGQVAEYKGGKTKVFGFFVGEAMKLTKGKANPQLLNEILKKRLDS